MRAALAAILLLLAATGSNTQAQLVIDPVFLSSITSDSHAATIENTIQAAINNIEGDIANPVTVYIDFGETNSGLGQSATYQYTDSYSDYLNILQHNQTLSAQDRTALASLNLSATTNPVNGSATIQSTAAVFRALGYTVPSGNPDSTIEFNPSIVNESLGTPTNGLYSLESVVTHEMDEVLGAGGGGSQLNGVQEGYTAANGAVGPLDLFRFSAAGVRSYTTTAGADPYFSINSGNTKLVYFNQSGTGDYADWGNGVTDAEAGNSPAQVQDAFGTPDTNALLGKNELTALDVIGWNLTAQGQAIENGTVPEPSTAYLLGGGLIALGIGRRARSKTKMWLEPGSNR